MILLPYLFLFVNFFALDPTALALIIPFCLICYVIYIFKKAIPSPHINIATLTPFGTPSDTSWKERFHFFPRLLKLIAFSALLLSFLDLRFYAPLTNIQPLPPEDNLASEGLAIYLVLDQSGSMAQKVVTRIPGNGYQSLAKFELVRQVTSSFIRGDAALNLPGRPNDLIGLVEFARTAQVVVPLTLDRKELLDKLAHFKPIEDPTQDGTAIGYALLKTGRLITATRDYARDLLGHGKPAYEIKNSLIILVTDGLQDPNPADKGSKWRQIDPREVANDLKKDGIRVYIINVEPSLATEEFAANRRQLQQTAEETGGKFYMITNGQNLDDIYASINSIEKSKLPLEENLAETLKQMLSKEKLPGLYNTFFLSPYLIGIALGCLFLSIVLESTFLRKAP
jgi:Ca-activated chloride channel homolog